MLDFIKRICIALALAVFIGILFIGTTTSFAAEVALPDELNESLIWPTVGDITDTFGTREGQHFGIDIAAPEGTPVVSISNGVINKSYYSDTYGQVIFVKHDNGLETVYAHLHERQAQEGQVVLEGEKIGTVGNTGRSSGNHLHFEVHRGDWNLDKTESIDPFLVLSREKEAMYAAVEGVPSEEDEWESENVVYVMSHQLIESSQSPPQQEEEEEEQTVFVVKEGDNLWDIANENNVGVDEIIKWNQLKNETIHPGQALIVYPNRDHIHVVQAGDTLISISQTYDIPVESIKGKNQLRDDLILQGTALTIK